MYNVITPAGIIEVATLTEAMQYKKMYGYPYIKIQDEFAKIIEQQEEIKQLIKLIPNMPILTNDEDEN